VLFLHLVRAIERVAHGFLLAALNLILVIQVILELGEPVFLIVNSVGTALSLFFNLIMYLGEMLFQHLIVGQVTVKDHSLTEL
jgi:hypothetical protein